jgi:hypothetical protein
MRAAYRAVYRVVSLALLLFYLFDNAVEFGIPGAETAREPIATARGNGFAVHDHIELASRTGYFDGFDTQALLDEGHETRDLGFIVASRRTMNDLDFHSVLPLTSFVDQLLV